MYGEELYKRISTASHGDTDPLSPEEKKRKIKDFYVLLLQYSTGSVSNRKPHLIFRLEVFLTPYTQHGYFAYIELKILQLEAFLSPGE
mgnify:CR=1 FL=1